MADAYFSTVSLLLHGDGPNGSTVFVDETGKTVSAIGTARISTTQSKFGGASMYFDGSSYATVPNDASFDFSSGADLTLEAWVNLVAYDVERGIMCGRENSTANGWFLSIDSTGKLILCGVTGTAYEEHAMHNTAVVLNTWAHVALVKQSTGYTAYLNGVAGPLWAVTSGLIYAAAQPFAIGTVGSLGQFKFLGYIDEVRVSKGIARYTANFTPDTSAFPAGNMISGTVRDSTGAFAARTVRAYSRVSGGLMGSTISDAVTGYYVIKVSSADEATVLTLDNAVSGTFYNDLVARVIPA